jgi:dethiobiotin synthetase
MVIITGTDTDVGKTIAASWLCLHTGYGYFKPIQTGLSEGRDSETVASLARAKVYPESYCFNAPVSPHLAAQLENRNIEIEKISLPQNDNLVIEGAGGVCVPVNEQSLMLDLFAHLNRPMILVSSSRLGTINHTLLSIKAIREYRLPLLGVIMMGEDMLENRKAIEYYGATSVLAVLPWFDELTQVSLSAVALPESLSRALDRP